MTNWEKLFGTPKKTVETIYRNTSCCDCPLTRHCSDECLMENESILLEWLESEVCDD